MAKKLQGRSTGITHDDHHVTINMLIVKAHEVVATYKQIYVVLLFNKISAVQPVNNKISVPF